MEYTLKFNPAAFQKLFVLLWPTARDLVITKFIYRVIQISERTHRKRSITSEEISNRLITDRTKARGHDEEGNAFLDWTV